MEMYNFHGTFQLICSLCAIRMAPSMADMQRANIKSKRKKVNEGK